MLVALVEVEVTKEKSSWRNEEKHVRVRSSVYVWVWFFRIAIFCLSFTYVGYVVLLLMLVEPLIVVVLILQEPAAGHQLAEREEEAEEGGKRVQTAAATWQFFACGAVKRGAGEAGVSRARSRSDQVMNSHRKRKKETQHNKTTKHGQR